MILVMEQLIEDRWDERNWGLISQGPKPMEAYQEYLEDRRTARNAVPIDELTPAEQSWYRAT